MRPEHHNPFHGTTLERASDPLDLSWLHARPILGLSGCLGCCMRRLLFWITSLFLLLTALGAETTPPTTRYRLHADKEGHSAKWGTPRLCRLPDQAVLILIPQPRNKWALKRLTGWETAIPEEETLVFEGVQAHEGEWGQRDIEVNPAGTYAVVRFRSCTGDFFPGHLDCSAAVVLVDLRTFAVVSRQVTRDPLLADSDFVFARNGLLIVQALVGATIEPPRRKQRLPFETLTQSFKATAIALPGWDYSMTCNYERLIDNRADSDHFGVSLRDLSSGCAALVTSAHVTTVEELPGDLSLSRPRPEVVPHCRPPSQPDAAIDRPNCYFEGVSPTSDFALYSCLGHRRNLDIMTVFRIRGSLDALSSFNAQPVRAAPLRQSRPPSPAVLANAGGHTWLVLVRDGVKLETYRLP